MKPIKQGAIIYKYSVLLICFLVGAFLFRGCKCGRDKIKEVPVVTIDTHYLKQDTFISYVPQPYKVSVPYRVDVAIESDSMILAAALKDGIISKQQDSIGILRDYLSTRYYSDSFKIQYGKIYTRDTVRANKIIGKSVATALNIPVITKTYTIQAQKRNVVLFGVGFLGNQRSPLFGAEASFLLKNKRDKIYEIGATILSGGDLYYSFGVKIPIKLN